MTPKEDLGISPANCVSDISPQCYAQTMRTDKDSTASWAVRMPLKTGDKVPDFYLSDIRGECVRLQNLLQRGPVVIRFYRGGWCPYCDLQLRALQDVLPQIRLLRSELVAISPDQIHESRLTAEKNNVTFPVLSDIGSATAKDFGIAYDPVEELRPFFARGGHILPEATGDENWILPMPATYIVNSDGIVASAFLDSHYRNRVEPAEIISALRTLLAGKLRT